jgi:hypothetical protein
MFMQLGEQSPSDLVWRAPTSAEWIDHSHAAPQINAAPMSAVPASRPCMTNSAGAAHSAPSPSRRRAGNH